MPTIEAWESALATRDAVFLQLAVLSVGLVLAFGLFRAAKKIMRLAISAGLLLMLGLLAFSVWNIWTW